MERLISVLAVSEILMLIQSTTVGLRLFWFMCLWYCCERYSESSNKCTLDYGYKDTACCNFTSDSEIWHENSNPCFLQCKFMLSIAIDSAILQQSSKETIDRLWENTGFIIQGYKSLSAAELTGTFQGSEIPLMWYFILVYFW